MKNVVKVVHSLGCFLFVTITNYGCNSSRKIKWHINFGVAWVSRFEVDIIEGVCCFVKDICRNFAIGILYDSYIGRKLISFSDHSFVNLMRG